MKRRAKRPVKRSARPVKRPTHFFVATGKYTGLEHRDSIRVPANITIHFPEQDKYRTAHTKDVSVRGILFEHDNTLPVASYVVLEIDLPDAKNEQPIAMVGQVVRVIPIEDGRYNIAIKTIKLSTSDAAAIMAYARAHKGA